MAGPDCVAPCLAGQLTRQLAHLVRAERGVQRRQNSFEPPVERLRIDLEHPGGLRNRQSIAVAKGHQQMILTREQPQRITHGAPNGSGLHDLLPLLQARIGPGRRIEAFRNRIFAQGCSRTAHGAAAAERVHEVDASGDVCRGAHAREGLDGSESIARHEALETYRDRPHPVGGRRRAPAPPLAIPVVEKHALQHDGQIRAKAARALEATQHGVVMLDQLQECLGPEFVQRVASYPMPPGDVADDRVDEREVGFQKARCISGLNGFGAHLAFPFDRGNARRGETEQSGRVTRRASARSP